MRFGFTPYRAVRFNSEVRDLEGRTLTKFMKKILVTGGAGFIGSNLVDALIDEGHDVVVVDNLYSGKRENLNPKAKFYQIDICGQELERVFQKERPDIIDHHAAQIDLRKSVSDPIFDAQINILGSINVLSNCQKYKVKKVIFASTGGAIYGDASVLPTPEDYPAWPVSPYGIAKLTVEHYLYFYHYVYGLPFIALRYGNVYGPRQDPHGEAGVVAIFTQKMLKGEQPIINGDGLQTRDFVFVSDVVKANLAAVVSNYTGPINIGTSKLININLIFNTLNKLIGGKAKEIHREVKKGEQKTSCLNINKAKQILGWEPKVELEEGLKKTVDYFKNIQL